MPVAAQARLPGVRVVEATRAGGLRGAYGGPYCQTEGTLSRVAVMARTQWNIDRRSPARVYHRFGADQRGYRLPSQRLTSNEADLRHRVAGARREENIMRTGRRAACAAALLLMLAANAMAESLRVGSTTDGPRRSGRWRGGALPLRRGARRWSGRHVAGVRAGDILLEVGATLVNSFAGSSALRFAGEAGRALPPAVAARRGSPLQCK